MKQKAKKEDMFSPLADATVAFLKKKGWKVLVIGSPRIQKQPGDLDFNYEFVLRFTGKKL